MIPVVTIVGKSGAGKTTIIERLITELKSRGFRVAAVKHAHQTVETDAEGKDTWRFSNAGSDASIVCSPAKVTIFKSFDKEPAIEEVVAALGGDYDLVILEGFKKSNFPKIEVFRSALGKDPVCTSADLLAMITDDALPFDIPRFGTGDTSEITDFIEKEVVSGTGSNIWAFANGKQVFMKPFVKDIISSAILAMLGSLKNTGIIRNATVYIKNRL